jgi:hypothetical protein
MDSRLRWLSLALPLGSHAFTSALDLPLGSHAFTSAMALPLGSHAFPSAMALPLGSHAFASAMALPLGSHAFTSALALPLGSHALASSPVPTGAVQLRPITKATALPHLDTTYVTRHGTVYFRRLVHQPYHWL